MEKTIFKNKWTSYLRISFIGVLAGLLVAFFSQFPSDDLWSFSFFSSENVGFWIFTSSLIALFSARHYVAGIHVSLYVYFMFYITGIFKRLTIVSKGHNDAQYFWDGLWENLAYGLTSAVVCFALAFVLWYGRKNKLIFILFRFAPLLLIVAEAVLNWSIVLNRGQRLFMALVDTACAVGYLLIILKASDFKNDRTAKNPLC